MTEPMETCTIEDEKMCSMADAGAIISSLNILTIAKRHSTAELTWTQKGEVAFLRTNRHWHKEWPLQNRFSWEFLKTTEL